MKIITFYIILFVYPFQSFCVSDYFEDNPIWLIHSACAINTPACIESKDYNYYINGDTIFNSHGYKKVYTKGNGFYTWSHNPPAPPYCRGSFINNDSINPAFFVRDTLNKIYISINNLDTLLFDYNLSVNDTLPMTYNNANSDITVTGIDSVLIGTNYRLRFHLSSNSISQYLIEGVGHDRGFIEPLYVGFDCSYSLICFGLGDSSYYPNSGLNCNIILNNNDIFLKIIIFNIGPNPVNNILYINSIPLIDKKYILIIYNILYQQLIVYEFDNNSNKHIDISALASGIYLYQIFHDQEYLQNGLIVKNR